MHCDSDVDLDSSDEDNQLSNLQQLRAVLDAEDETYSESSSKRTHYSVASTSALEPTTPASQQLQKFDSALALNNMYFETTRRLENLMCIRLNQCREKLMSVQNKIKNINSSEKLETFRYINCGRPYFKDKLNYPAPDNEDTILAKSQMYDFSLVTSVPGWTVKDKSQFVAQIHKMSQDLRRNELYSKIAAVKRMKPLTPKRESEIAALQSEIEKLKKMPLSQLALPIEQEYDWELLAHQLNRRHTAQEYQALWKLFFHPSINKSNWSKTEHNNLRKIANDNNYQNWDGIAKQLNTGRTGYQCFVYHRTNMTSSFSGKRWTHEEITYLKRLIDYFKEDTYIPWGKIAAAMENRTKIQIYNKYMRLVEQRKGRFLAEEDAVILNCAHRFGKDFRKMANYLPGRSMVQIRTRYATLKKLRISTVWSVEEDRKLIQIMTNQDTLNFSEVTKYFPGKNRINLRTRYVTLVRWMQKYPHLDIKYAPRRGARRLCHGQPSDDLSKAIENLKNILSSEVEHKAAKGKITINSPEGVIEDAIMATLFTEHYHAEQRKYQDCTIVADQQMTADFNVTNLTKCLLLLNSHLNKESYENSSYRNIYPNLGEDRDNCVVKVKSYSRKNKVETVLIPDAPDVWGNISLNSTRYVLPPHYATITGCKALMSYISTSNKLCEVDINVMIRRNSLLKHQFQLLQDRFYSLFLWPMLMSNEGPLDFRNMKKSVESLSSDSDDD